MANSSEDTQELFQKLKEICVPLLGYSKITPGSVPAVLGLLSRLVQILREVQSPNHALKPSLISYVFFPLSTILRRNEPGTIPDQVLEKILVALSILCDRWWWDMDEVTWEQVFMLCGAVIGGMESKGKGKDRADETKEAAAQCLWTLVRIRERAEDPVGSETNETRSNVILDKFRAHAQSETFMPILGQSLNSLLGTIESLHMPLRRTSLDLINTLIEYYLPDPFIPSVLPGVISAMCKVALGTGQSKGWANGDTVAGALKVVQVVTVRGIGNDVCTQEGAVKDVSNLEDLMELTTEGLDSNQPMKLRYFTPRTASWLRGTASQLHIALKSLQPLISHPTPSALLGLASCSSSILLSTTLTLPQSQPLLLSYLLSLSGSSFDFVSESAKNSLVDLLSPPSPTRHALLQIVLQISKDQLTSLPRLLSSRSDSKVEHAAQIVESICNLTYVDANKIQGTQAISTGVSVLLGPRGGIERWGWSLLLVLEFLTPSVMVASTSTAQLTLEGNGDDAQVTPFPELTLKAVNSRSARTSLERMLRSLGSAAGEESLYAVEWFIGIGKGSKKSHSVAALWCAARVLEGAAGFSLDDPLNQSLTRSRNRKLEKLARGYARSISELWEEDEFVEPPEQPKDGIGDDINDLPLVEHVSGLVSLRSGLINDRASRPVDSSGSFTQPHLHKALSLQLLAITSGILQARFAPLLLHALYPVLHSIISPSSHLALTALATLRYITHTTSFASPANLLLSNFDYALDAISRRLSRRWLDVEAARVLVLLIRLVGRDVVQKAGDVVEECFDRLDEYHGYEVLVDGLVAVLTEVAQIVGTDESSRLQPRSTAVLELRPPNDGQYLDSFLDWYSHRKSSAETEKEEDFGPVPRRAWGEKHEEERDDDAADGVKAEDTEPPATPAQLLTKQIVSRSMYFLTHGSPLIRARILNLLASSVPVLPSPSLLPSIHQAWPFILNRFSDQEPFVVNSAAALIESLATHVGDFMSRRLWDDIWPRFRTLLDKLEATSQSSALSRMRGVVGTESAYTHSHRLYRAIIRTMTAAVSGVQVQDSAAWEVIMKFRCFLHNQVHEELQSCARDLYTALSLNNADAVWLALHATEGSIEAWTFFREKKWEIEDNLRLLPANVH